MKKKYYLHYKARKEGFKLITKERTFYMKPDTPISKAVKILISKYNYQIQLEI